MPPAALPHISPRKGSRLAVLEYLSPAAVWGFAGALSYAVPRATLAAFTDRARGLSVWPPLIVGAAALFTGTIIGHAFTPWALDLLGRKDADLAAVAIVCGLVGNPAAEVLVKQVSKASDVLDMLKGASGK